MNIQQLVYPFYYMDIWVVPGFKAITNIATLNTPVCVLVYRCAHSFWGIYLGVKLLGHSVYILHINI